MNHWTTPYIGLPYVEFGRDWHGIDCWGLASLVYEDQLKITLPSYTERYTSVEEHAELAALICDVTTAGPWKEVPHSRAFDIAIFRRGHTSTHVGIVVSPGLMLHISMGYQSCLEHYVTGRWGNRLAGVYRHADAAARAV